MEMSLADLAKKVKVTSSLLSQVENNKALPSIITLSNIAKALNSSVSELIGENDPHIYYPVIKAEERKLVREVKNQGLLFVIPQHPYHHNLDVFILVLKKQGSSEKLLDSKQGEIYLMVQKGTITLELMDDVYSLKNGDSIFFNANSFHGLYNLEEQAAEILWIITGLY